MYFDLDGTLWDATESTAMAWTEVFNEIGFSIEVNAQQIKQVAGKPYLECLKIVAPSVATSPDIQTILPKLEAAERRWMAQVGGQLYPGVIEGLHKLANKNNIFLVSNCNAWYLDAFLDSFDLRNLFTVSTCYGCTGLVKSENLKNIMIQFGHESGYYVGDTIGDKNSAESVGLNYIHAEYGFAGSTVHSKLFFSDFNSVVEFLLSKQLA